MNALFMKIQEHFIHEKIAIPNLAPRTSRPRLLKLLTDNLHSANATVINGRAGSGKSVLAADFARHVGRAVAWYKVEAADNDLRVFCEYLAAAVRRQRPSIDAMAPGLHAAADERLAAFTILVATGSPDSTCTVTAALAFPPAESMAVN